MSQNHSSEIIQCLNTAALARLTLAGKREGRGFWTMPHGRHFVMECWRGNMARARELNAESRANRGRALPVDAGGLGRG